MSATNRGTPRAEHDRYTTPTWLIDAILPHLARRLAGLRRTTRQRQYMLDPAAGATGGPATLREVGQVGEGSPLGVMARQARAGGLLRPLDFIRELDIANDPEQDFFAQSFDDLTREIGRPDLILTNPPYTLAWEFAKRSIELVQPGGVVALLLRLNFLGGQKRAAWMRENPPSVYVTPRRPSFTDGGTDATEYAWFVWQTKQETAVSRQLVRGVLHPNKPPAPRFTTPVVRVLATEKMKTKVIEKIVDGETAAL